MRVENYEVGRQFAETTNERLYLGTDVNDGKEVIIKVAKTSRDNQKLMESARVLVGYWSVINAVNATAGLSDEFRATFKRGRYDLLAAYPLDSSYELTPRDKRISIVATQSARFISIVTLPDVKFSEVMPLSDIGNDYLIDARTAVWILGRILKFYQVFGLFRTVGRATYKESHMLYRCPLFSMGNFLIAPRRHRVIFYHASKGTETIPGTPRDILEDITLSFVKYTQNLPPELSDLLYFELLRRRVDSFTEAHQMLYEVADKIWPPREFYPFTYQDKNGGEWKTIGEYDPFFKEGLNNGT